MNNDTTMRSVCCSIIVSHYVLLALSTQPVIGTLVEHWNDNTNSVISDIPQQLINHFERPLTVYHKFLLMVVQKLVVWIALIMSGESMPAMNICSPI